MTATASEKVKSDHQRVVELHMMDMMKYYPLVVTTSMTIRGIIYPITLITTRLQVQKGSAVYKGTLDGLVQVVKSEGITGLYRGAGIRIFGQLIPSLVYISTYEYLRHILYNHTPVTNSSLRGMVAGCSAAVFNQLFITPLDIVSQHLMTMPTGNRPEHVKLKQLQTLNIPESIKHQRFGVATAVAKEIYKQQGLRGFWQGYSAAAVTFGISSGCWWTVYDLSSDLLHNVLPESCPRVMINSVAAVITALSITFITNPFDLVRTRMQMYRTSVRQTISRLVREEGMSIFTKAISARMSQSVVFSFLIVSGYESVKRLSLLDEYKNSVRW